VTLRILATAPLRGPGLDQLRTLGEVIEEPWITGPASPMKLLGDEQLAERLRELGAEVVITEADSVKAATLALPLRAVGSTRGDPTNVDLVEATAQGVPVLRAPGRNADGVAELAVALALACTRGIVSADADVRAGEVYRDGTIPYQRFRSWQLAGRTVGIVGFGAVGRAAAWRFEGMGMHVLSYDPFAPDATHTDLDEMLGACHVVSVHAAVTPDTVGLLSAERFARMPAGSVFVNTARAALHDLDALTAALASGHLAAAALDHFEGESIATDHPLVGMPNVVLTPHIGGATFDTEANHTQAMADGLATILEGKRPSNLANPEVHDGRHT
jgi:D-3-phosphoglycerate dehydrogenase / 2-oxoglutarate reductase